MLYSNIVCCCFFFHFAFLFLCLSRAMCETLNVRNRFTGANAWNGCARNNVTRAANDANDATISVISSRTAVCDNGGPGNTQHSNNCTYHRSSNNNCTNLRYLLSTSTSTSTSSTTNNSTSNY